MHLFTLIDNLFEHDTSNGKIVDTSDASKMNAIVTQRK